MFAQTAKEIFTYVLRDMTAPEGGFYSAEDADSEGEEGRFYLWTQNEIMEVLGEEDGKLFTTVYNIENGGNYQEQSVEGITLTGLNIPHLRRSSAEFAHQVGQPIASVQKRLEFLRRKLFDRREMRIHPHKDDKILTDWNGLMIAALAKGGKVLNEPSYTEAATRAADFILAELSTEKNVLHKRYRQESAGLPAHLEDYAFMAWGLLELYEANFEVAYLQRAIDLTQITLNSYWDKENGGFFQVSSDHDPILFRPKNIYDGAIPSGNSVAALNLIRLERITANDDYGKRASMLFKAFSGQLSQRPSIATFSMAAYNFALGPSYEIVIAGNKNNKDTQNMRISLFKLFLPNKVVIFRPDGENPSVSKIAPYTRNQVARDNKATVYVCQNFSCKLPTTDIDKMLDLLDLEESH